MGCRCHTVGRQGLVRGGLPVVVRLAESTNHFNDLLEAIEMIGIYFRFDSYIFQQAVDEGIFSN